MIGIKMKPNIPVHYQEGKTLQKGNSPLPTYNMLKDQKENLQIMDKFHYY
jgi:hypothetical protein